MRSTDIRTAQQVQIHYQLANLRDRGLAQLLDLVFWSVGSSLIMTILGVLGVLRSEVLSWVFLLPLVVVLYTYSLLFEWLWRGQTPAKRLMGLQVVKLNGADPGFSDYATRWAFRLIDLWASLGAVGGLLIGTSERSQRLGDMLADTIVVRLRPDNVPSLDRLLAMHANDAVDRVRFPNAALAFSEQDMLLALQVLDRYRRFANEAHIRLLENVAEKLASGLGIPDWRYPDVRASGSGPAGSKTKQKDPDFLSQHDRNTVGGSGASGKPGGNAARFVQTVLQDYVVLTR